MPDNRKTSNILSAIMLLALAAALHSPALFTRKVMLPSDIVRYTLPWGLELPYSPDASKNGAVVSDAIFAQYPAQVYFKKSLDSGRLPLWNPYQSAGRPFAAVGQTQVFYPISALLTKTASPEDFFELFAFIHCAMAGVFMFLFMRCSRCGPAPSFIAGAGYMLTGWLVHWTMFPSLLGPAAWAPLVLLFTELAIRKSNLKYSLLAGAALGLDLLCGNPQISAYVVVAATIAAAGSVLSKNSPASLLKKSAFAASSLCVAVIAGVFLSAVQFLLTCDLLSQTSRAPALWDGAGKLFLALPFILPHVYGNTANATYLLPGPSFMEGAAYSGAAVFLLAAIALPLRKDARSASWTAVALLGAAAAAGAAFLRVNNHIPGLKMTHLGRLVFLFPLSVPVLAALAWDHIEKNSSSARNNIRNFATAAIAATAILACSLSVWRASLHAIGAPSGTAAALASRSFIHAAVAMAAIAAAVLASKKHRRAASAFAAACAAADLFLCAWGFNPAGNPDILIPETPSISFLKSQKPPLCRFNATHKIIFPNFSTALELYDLRGYEPLGLSRYSQLIRAINLKASVNTGWEAVVFPAEIHGPALDMMGECLIASMSQLNSPGLAKIYKDKINIYRNANALPRAVFYTRWKVEKNAPRLLREITSPAFNPKEELYLEREPAANPRGPGGATRKPAPGIPATRASVTLPAIPRASTAIINKYEPETIEITAQSDQGGMLFLSDSYERGWTAAIDGRPAEIIPANHAFRAVPVGPGKHKITMAYRPRSLRIGFALSSAALVFLLIATSGTARSRG